MGCPKMEYTKEVTNRMKRLEGQVRGVLKMMEEEKHCKDVVTQLSAVRTAVDRTLGLIVAKNLEACIRESEEEGINAEDAIQEAVNMLVRSR
jgi:DNA-binding FrmR family transcriptional regulator